MKKNETYEFEIVDNGSNFEGIAKKDGQVIFIKDAIMGEKVKAKIIKENKKYSIAKIEEFLEQSDKRVNPICNVSKRCGGCSAMHISYDMQLEIKNKMVENLLKKQNLDTNLLEKTIGMKDPFFYRNKVQYPVRNINGDNKIGFYTKRSHDIIENDICYIQDKNIDALAKDVFNFLIKENFNGYNEKDFTGDIRHILIRRGYHTDKIMIVIVVNNKKLLKDKRFSSIIQNLISKNKNIKSIFLNLNDKNTNEILGENCFKIYGEDYISDKIGKYEYYISPKSFFQVNTIQAEVLYNTLKDNLCLNSKDIIFDLYSGVGSIGIYLSDLVNKVYGIEIEKQAVEMSNLNLKLNNVSNAEYIAGSVEDKIIEFKNRNIKPDVIVVDPPRRGLDEKSIEYILEFNPSKIGYVSCNPATMARDLKMLSEKYDVLKIVPVDMFPHTSSIECVCVLQGKNIKK